MKFRLPSIFSKSMEAVCAGLHGGKVPKVDEWEGTSSSMFHLYHLCNMYSCYTMIGFYILCNIKKRWRSWAQHGRYTMYTLYPKRGNLVQWIILWAFRLNVRFQFNWWNDIYLIMPWQPSLRSEQHQSWLAAWLVFSLSYMIDNFLFWCLLYYPLHYHAIHRVHNYVESEALV